MSRIEDALRRVGKQSQTGEAQTPSPEPAEHRRPENVETPVVSAWQFDRFPSEAETETPPDRQAHTEPEPREELRRGAAVVQAGAARGFELRAHAPERAATASRVAERLAALNDSSPISAEQYRKLAASLHQEQLERNIKVVMIASAMSGEGKTFTAANLALTLSQSYRRRVLLVDADLRRPQMHELFQLPAVAGLTEGLKSEEPRPLSVFEVAPRLVLLPAGRPDPDPMGILTSQRMRHVIDDASAAFDWVILDTPPVVLLPDTHLLADMVDVAILVLAAGKTPYRMVARAVEVLGKDRILGVVLNGADESVVAATSGYARDDRYVGPYAPVPAPK